MTTLKLSPDLAVSFAKIADVVANDRDLGMLLIEIAFLCYEIDGSSRAVPLLEQVQRIVPVELLTCEQVELLGL